MSYLGNQPNSAAFLTDQFSGNGSTTTFTLSTAPAGTTSILVSVSGVLQDPTTYSVVGTTLTLGGAAPTGTGNISVRYLGIPAAGVVTTAYRTVTEFTATAGQTTFTPPSYSVGFIAVYLNGARLGAADFTASNGTTIVLATGASVDDLVVTESFYISSVANAIPNIPGAVVESNIGSGAVTSSKLASSLSLVTPNLGTPSALTLTNATGLPLSTGVTGTLPYPQFPVGSILQTKTFTNVQLASMNTTTFTEPVSDYRLSITPKSASSRILLTYGFNVNVRGTLSVIYHFRAIRNPNGTSGTLLTSDGGSFNGNLGNRTNMNASIRGPVSDLNDCFFIYFQAWDEPNTTSQIQYGLHSRRETGGDGTISFNHSVENTSSFGWMCPFTITAVEIAQ